MSAFTPGEDGLSAYHRQITGEAELDIAIFLDSKLTEVNLPRVLEFPLTTSDIHYHTGRRLEDLRHPEVVEELRKRFLRKQWGVKVTNHTSGEVTFTFRWNVPTVELDDVHWRYQLITLARRASWGTKCILPLHVSAKEAWQIAKKHAPRKRFRFYQGGVELPLYAVQNYSSS